MVLDLPLRQGLTIFAQADLELEILLPPPPEWLGLLTGVCYCTWVLSLNSNFLCLCFLAH
jgi:hypothetical protein